MLCNLIAFWLAARIVAVLIGVGFTVLVLWVLWRY